MGAGRITTIVAVDVDGFSAMAEADEAGAIAAVARLGERCAKIASEHGGRIFNTSGDAVMMEFSSAFGAVHAALDLSAVSDPPIRVAVHTGEVSPLPTGDLLGHGVSVAGRLQRHARPGLVIVSEDTRKALRGPLVDKLAPKGSIKLEKMDENIAIYELSATDTAGVKRPWTRRQMLWAGGGIVAAFVLLALIAAPLFSREPQSRAAVLSLAAAQENLQGIAEGVAEDMSAALQAAGVNTLARESRSDATRELQLDRARASGAAFALEGSVERADRELRITVSVARTADRASLWSEVIEGPQESATELRHRAASHGVRAISCALRAGGTAPADAYALLLTACARGEDPDAGAQNRDVLSQAVAQAPDLALARAMLAAQTAALLDTASEPQRQQLRDEVHDNAERALRQDRSLGEAYLALERIEPRRRRDARERTLQRGLEHDERSSELSAEYSALLFEVGRFDDALTYARNASTLDPLSLNKRVAVGEIALQAGDMDAARDATHELTENWPDALNVWPLRLRLAFWSGAYDDALEMINAPASQVRSTRARQCWRYAAEAMRAQENSAARASAVRQVIDCSDSGDLPTAQALMQFSRLGMLDEAFALARERFGDEQRGGEDVLFGEATRAMRADNRFMPLMRELGLLAYWRLSGHWPDFCRDPSLPYRCQTEAQRLQ
ncbi:MAG: adenylate/guanylate cyclase domain-containing protein [Hyphomonadaceae bacterium]|nr:adenylate/guanylate cyclase domain-containing protein [Hyphomonadaceae bacterium]